MSAAAAAAVTPSDAAEPFAPPTPPEVQPAESSRIVVIDDFIEELMVDKWCIRLRRWVAPPVDGEPYAPFGFTVSGDTYPIRSVFRTGPGLFRSAHWDSRAKEWIVTVYNHHSDDDRDQYRARGMILHAMEMESHVFAEMRRKRGRKAAETRRLRQRKWTPEEAARIEANYARYEATPNRPDIPMMPFNRGSRCDRCSHAVFANPRVHDYATQSITGCWQCGHSFVD